MKTKKNTLRKKCHLTTVTDFGLEDIRKVFALAHKMKKTPQYFSKSLEGKMFGLVFEKPSTRTWVSFESGLFSLGAGTIYLGPQDIKLGVREEVRDVARVLGRYLSGVVLRTFDHKTIEEFGKYFNGTIINGLSDMAHPCQALTDFFTIQEFFPGKKKPVITFVGDGNNVLNSLILVAALLGYEFRYATPKGHEPNPAMVRKSKQLAKKSGASILAFHDPVKAVSGADVVYTDVWVSMGEEKMKKKKTKAFKHMQVNGALMKKANPGAKVMHCLPAHRGEEITNEVIEGRNSIVFDQAENRLHVQKAILVHLCA